MYIESAISFLINQWYCGIYIVCNLERGINKLQCCHFFSRSNIICCCKKTFDRMLYMTFLYIWFDKSCGSQRVLICIAVHRLTLCSPWRCPKREILFSIFLSLVCRPHALPWNPQFGRVRVWNTRACINIAGTGERKREKGAGRMLFAKPLWRDTLCGIPRNCSGINAVSYIQSTWEMRLTVREDRCTLRVEMFAQTKNNESAWNLCRRDVEPRIWPFQILASKPRRDSFDWLKELSIICALRALRSRALRTRFPSRSHQPY